MKGIDVTKWQHDLFRPGGRFPYDPAEIEVPNKSVYNGTWTMDQYLSIVKDFYQDANGNSERDAEDVYGWAANKKLYCMQATYVNCYKEGKEGTVSLDFDREKLIDLTAKIGEVLLSSPGGYLTGAQQKTTGTGHPVPVSHRRRMTAMRDHPRRSSRKKA